MPTACMACGRSLPAGAQFCIGCGQAAPRTCAACGGPISAQALFCGTCAADVASFAVAPAAPAAPVATVAPMPSLPVPAPPIPPWAAPVGLAYPAPVTPAPTPVRSARRRPILLVGGTLAVVAVLVATIGWSGVLTSQSPAAGDAPTESQGASPQPSYPAVGVPPLVEITNVDSTQVAATGKTVTDAHGVSVTLAESATSGSSAIQLEAGDLPASFDASMVSDDGWKRISKVYSLELDNNSDVIGNVPLSFPSSSADDRVAVLMDGRHLLVLGVTPASGHLTVQASTQSATSPAFEGEGDHYFVVTKATPASAPGGRARMAAAVVEYRQESSGGKAAASAAATCDYGRFPPRTTCWNAAKSISFQAGTKLDSDWEAKVGVFLDRVATIMKKYGTGTGNLGFEHANPTPDDPIRIVIDSSSDADPNYDPGLLPWCSTIYVGFHSVANIDNAGEQQLMAHELFHWVQHHTYPMRLDGNSPTKYWHTETQAEAASFLVDPTYQPARLLKVASQLQTNGTQGVLGWQKSAGAWDSGLIKTLADPSRYVQGQVVSLGICDGTSCIESQKDLIDEVNGGYRHYSGANYHWGLDNTIRYLLGTAPVGVNVDLTPPILETGRGIGDYIHGNQKPGNNKDYAVINNPTNLTKTPASGEIEIHAAIASNGLYPLRVSNGSDVPLDDNCLPNSNRFSGKELEPNGPYNVHLEAGVEVYWRIGDGPVQHSDGSGPLDIGPITSQPSVGVQLADHTWTTKSGIPSVRIIAVNRTDGPVTLSGNVAPQAPKTVASPDMVATTDPNTPVQLRVDLTQVALNFAGATAEWDFGDGSPTQPTTITPDAKLQASIQVTHTFAATSTGVRVTFRDNAGKPLAWDPVNIPIGETGVHWVLVSSTSRLGGPGTFTVFGTTTVNSTDGHVTSASDEVVAGAQVHSESSSSWGPPPPTAVPGDTWATTLSVQATSSDNTLVLPTVGLRVTASWTDQAGAAQSKEWFVRADGTMSPQSKALSWAFPVPNKNSGAHLDIVVYGSDDWTYHYEWRP